ncbi:DUF2303 family protein [Pseudovibrio ascidiaceicola]|uniref:DUF2303 family protein n=1 Tax=Pseudovibrio ascidiaceicola TaxID=285279 RepID=UPI003D35C45C
MELSTELSADAIQKIAEMAGQNKAPEIVTVQHTTGKELSFLITRQDQGGMKLTDLSANLALFDLNPHRVKGTSEHLTLESLIDHANRFSNNNSVLFADIRPQNLSIQCVLNYHDALNQIVKGDGEVIEANEKPLPQHSDHKGLYRFPLSDQWQVWNKASLDAKSQDEFSFFLEDNITDVMALPNFLKGDTNEKLSEPDRQLYELVQTLEGRPCSSEKLMQLAKGLQIHEANQIETGFNRNSGEQQIVFKEEHQGADGKPLSVPNMFLISIPVFKNSAPYRIPVRLRYRKAGGTIKWLVSLHNPERMLEHAFNEACDLAKQETGLPLFFGKPE